MNANDEAGATNAGMQNMTLQTIPVHTTRENCIALPVVSRTRLTIAPPFGQHTRFLQHRAVTFVRLP